MTVIPLTVPFHITAVIFMGYRILNRRLSVNTTLAWIIIIATLPIAGIVLYFLFGDHRLGRKRLKLGERIRNYYQSAYAIKASDVPDNVMEVSPFFEDLSRVVAEETGFHPSMGNKIQLFDEAGHVFSSLVSDINQAETSCFLEFYIVEAEGRVIPVLEALERAALRGIECKFLADDIGSRGFLKSEWYNRLEAAGVEAVRSLEIGIIKSFSKRMIYEVIVAALFGARKSIAVVTPYFVPDEALVLALTNAARRGINVVLILPRRIDSIMARYASEAVYEDLLRAGVVIRRYESGMLHTKAILIDDDISFVGTVNLDMRSFYLNLEATLAIYDKTFAARLKETVDHYVARSDILDYERWKERSTLTRLKENILRLATPLL